MSERRKRVAIVGFCNDSRDMAPYEDETVEIWGLNRGYIFMHRIDRHFDMHGPHIYLHEDRRPGDHLGWLKQFPGPVYMHRADPAIPNSVTYPLAEVAQAIGSTLWRWKPEQKGTGAIAECMGDSPYLSSSIAYEIALAIYEGYEEIQLWGIDLNTDSEYAWQKPGVEHLLGVALGRGIKVVLPDNCPLLRGNLYGRGYLSPEGEKMSLDQLKTRAKALEQQQTEVGRQLSELTGARKELDFVMQQLVPGLDHERLDERKKRMGEAISQLQQKLLQINGARNETAFWIHQTPNGQDPAEAIEQLHSNGNGNGNGHHYADADGPVTELQLMQTPDQPVDERLAVGV